MVVQPLTGDRQSALERVQEVSGDGDTSLINAVDLGLIIGQSNASIASSYFPDCTANRVATVHVTSTRSPTFSPAMMLGSVVSSRPRV